MADIASGANTINLDGDGFVTVRLGDAAIELDLIDCWEKYCSFCSENDGQPDFTARLLEWVQSLGVPVQSQFQAIKFANALSRHIEQKKSEAEMLHVLPDSTVSGPAT